MPRRILTVVGAFVWLAVSWVLEGVHRTSLIFGGGDRRRIARHRHAVGELFSHVEANESNVTEHYRCLVAGCTQQFTPDVASFDNPDLMIKHLMDAHQIDRM